MMKRSGNLIVLEGLDGAGTTTQAMMLHEYFLSRGKKSYFTCEPTDEPVGKLLRDALTGRLSSPGTGKKITFSEKARCLLFAADRQEHSLSIAKVLSNGVNVICDRYILSSIAYQMLDSSIPPEWVIEVNSGCFVPDLTIFLDVAVDECLIRLKDRKNRPTVYEKKSLLEAIRKNYKRALPVYEKHFGPVRRIDGRGAIEKTHKAVIAEIESTFPS
ncbi:MAG: dTMP kinase [Candidatus Latescibacteria bacterium]|nr:dTMP kinase [Candidatus Latescibacterota bacterium]NIM66457.1 dTMP kinase [Candidatus Latescibacterota bacterium]NIO02937.1 dTMP kinase [Candidatus Latescibacterota bacterium]NIO30072.1 dTMP kinase [Candidatus Latescibacterota bacterium]NIO57687.1 dTMP kinase [Candidatus Latescibacterota bacterium]